MRAIDAAFSETASDEDIERERRMAEVDRCFAAFDGPEIVGTAAAFTMPMTVPGAEIEIGFVTMVAVLPTHRRRGVNTALMRRQLDEAHERGEVVEVLHASEGGIYGRYGYGLATYRVVDRDRDGAIGVRPRFRAGGGASVGPTRCGREGDPRRERGHAARSSGDGSAGRAAPRLHAVARARSREGRPLSVRLARGGRWRGRLRGLQGQARLATGLAKVRADRPRSASSHAGGVRGPVAVRARRRSDRTRRLVEPTARTSRSCTCCKSRGACARPSWTTCGFGSSISPAPFVPGDMRPMGVWFSRLPTPSGRGTRVGTRSRRRRERPR